VLYSYQPFSISSFRSHSDFSHNNILSVSSQHSLAMPPSKAAKEHCKDHGHSAADVEGEKNEWKFREPYQIHGDDEGFKSLYEGACHCGRVTYQLSREKPLDSKFCHCTTCQVLHGIFLLFYPLSISFWPAASYFRTILLKFCGGR
jgi:hypothetical protein